jgi:hypothetical protein
MNNLLKNIPPKFIIDLDKELGRDLPPPTLIPAKPIQRTSKLFLKGPIPFDWLRKANALGGSTGIVATGLWLYVGLNSSKRFKVDSKLDQFAGVTRQTRQHALHKLKYAGLINLTEHHGAYPFIEVIIDVQK